MTIDTSPEAVERLGNAVVATLRALAAELDALRFQAETSASVVIALTKDTDRLVAENARLREARDGR